MKKCIILLFCIGLIISIMGCSRNEKIDKNRLILQMENDHFKFYSTEKDKSCIDDLSKTLEENYSRITSDLKVSLKNKVEIEIYPDINAYHKAIGMPDAPEWAVGSAWGDKIKMVSPLNPGKAHHYEALMQVIVHEFTHVVTGSINSLDRIPIWLSEGVAGYEAKQIPEIDDIKPIVDKDKIPSLSEMTLSNFSEIGGYQFSYTAVEYLIDEYGYDTLISLIKDPTESEKILGIDMTEFENRWKIYLKTIYQ